MSENFQESRDPLTEKVIGCAIEVHRILGPGLLESAYQRCLALELRKQGLTVETEVSMPVNYKGDVLDCGYRADLLVEKTLIAELKAALRKEIQIKPDTLLHHEQFDVMAL